MVPLLSLIGLQASLAAAATFSSVASSSVEPTSAFSASGTRTTVGATAPSAIAAAVHFPVGSSVMRAAQPTTAMSISVRGMKRR